MACSFQKEESVLIDLLMRIEPSARVFTIDTGVLFPETCKVWRQIENRYGLRIEVIDAGPPNGTPWSASNCCGARKVEALELALAGVDAWITGIRREQSPTRAGADTVEWAAGRGVWKFNPLAAWSSKTCGAMSLTTICPTIRCTTGGTNPSDALPARCRQRPRGPLVGAGEDRCGLHVERFPGKAYEHDRVPAYPAARRGDELRGVTPAGDRVRGDPRDP